MRLYPVGGALLWVFLASLALRAGPGESEKDVTYSKDVAPILFKSCAICHHPNDIAPMSLMTYKEVRPWAAAIREKVIGRTMPPWHADPKVGEFTNDPRLSDAEIETIRAWVNSGAKEGNAKDLPPSPVFQEGWHIKPDVILSIPEYVASEGTQDAYEFFFVPTNFTEDKWIQAAEVLPGDRRVVHHADAIVVSGEKATETREKIAKRFDFSADSYLYSTGRVRHVKANAPVVDDGCTMPEGGGFPDRSSGSEKIEPAIYLPGHLAETRPHGYALRIPAGAYVMFAIHYNNRVGADVKDRTSLGLVFATEPVKHEMAEYDVENMLFQIPPNDPNHRVTSCYTLPKDGIAVAYTAHMHYRGKSMTTEAVYPDGHRQVLFNVPHYDFRWQETYFLKHQFLLPKGTKLVTTAYFDNSPNNPLNPDPSKTIRFGEPSDEEMMSFWLHFADPQLVDIKDASAKANH